MYDALAVVIYFIIGILLGAVIVYRDRIRDSAELIFPAMIAILWPVLLPMLFVGWVYLKIGNWADKRYWKDME